MVVWKRLANEETGKSVAIFLQSEMRLIVSHKKAKKRENRWSKKLNMERESMIYWLIGRRSLSVRGTMRADNGQAVQSWNAGPPVLILHAVM